MDSTRKYLRYSCTGSADITDASNHRVWGTLADISMGGFYLSTYGPWDVGTEVSLKLDIDEQQIAGVGTVATSHPGVGMAIIFTSLAEEDQARLKEIVSRYEQAAAAEQDKGMGTQA